METAEICGMPLARGVASWSSFGTGGALAAMIAPRTVTQAVGALGFLENHAVDYVVLGGCTNVLIADGGYGGLCVDLRNLQGVRFDASGAYAEAGVRLPLLARAAAQNGLSGLERLGGIPGTLGGAIAGNAGAFGTEIGDLIDYADLWRAGKCERVTAEELGMRYRRCAAAERGAVILGARLKLEVGENAEIAERMRIFARKRSLTQPRERSLGCVFRRTPDGTSAALWIDRAGLKGMKIGGACVSTKHAGFIVNVGDARSDDFVRLADAVRERVDKLYGIGLQYEVKFLR